MPYKKKKKRFKELKRELKKNNSETITLSFSTVNFPFYIWRLWGNAMSIKNPSRESNNAWALDGIRIPNRVYIIAR